MREAPDEEASRGFARRRRRRADARFRGRGSWLRVGFAALALQRQLLAAADDLDQLWLRQEPYRLGDEMEAGGPRGFEGGRIQRPCRRSVNLDLLDGAMRMHQFERRAAIAD